MLPAMMAHAQKAVAGILHGEHPRAKSGAGEQFWQYREYAPEDRPQDIDWRQSAKTDRVFIRQKELQTTQKALFWCSNSPGMEFHSRNDLPAKREHAQIISLSLALLLTRAGERIGLLGQNRTGRSELALENFAQGLLTSKDRADLPHESSPPERNSVVFLVGDFIAPQEEIARCFAEFSAHEVSASIVQVLDPAEMTLDYQGRAIFESPRRDYHQHIANVSLIRDEYIQRIKRHIAFVDHLCHRYGWDYQLHTTDSDIDKTLSAIWMSAHARIQTLDKRPL